jgi:hypothetical protein
METGELNRACIYYNWGGDGTKERPSYPREYGARCERYNMFFSRMKSGANPDCSTCCFAKTH